MKVRGSHSAQVSRAYKDFFQVLAGLVGLRAALYSCSHRVSKVAKSDP